jgi:FkbM family methyltransferase
MKKTLLIIKAFVILPRAVKTEVLLYFINRLSLRQPTNHQTIWTSFLYFSSSPDSRLVFKTEGDLYKINFYSYDVYYETLIRGVKSTDIFVFFQVFIAGGYQPVISLLKQEGIIPNVIIDAGANAGYFSLLASHSMEFNKLIAIEPEPSNYELLIRNFYGKPFFNKLHFLKAALWCKKGVLSVDSEVGKEWATQVHEGISDKTCLAFGLKDILADFSINEVDILKLDIEGAEAVLFNDKDFIECLAKVKVVAIEIHDHLANRSHIKSVLSSKGFSLSDIGELTLAWKEL